MSSSPSWPSPKCISICFVGISGKSQVLFAITYLSRYLDLFTTYVSLYNSVMKVVFISASLATVYLMFVKFRATYDRNSDSFRIEFLLIPCAILALLINHEFSVLEVMWTFSIYLESVAILPQLFMVSKTGEAESITSHYLFALGSYRALYIFNWVSYGRCQLNKHEFYIHFFIHSRFGATLMRAITILLRLWLVLCKQFCTVTFSICTSPRVRRASSQITHSTH